MANITPSFEKLFFLILIQMTHFILENWGWLLQKVLTNSILGKKHKNFFILFSHFVIHSLIWQRFHNAMNTVLKFWAQCRSNRFFSSFVDRHLSSKSLENFVSLSYFNLLLFVGFAWFGFEFFSWFDVTFS